MSRIVSIVYTPEEIAERRPALRYARVILEFAELIEDQGIAGDQKSGTVQNNRHLNVMSAEALAALALDGFRTGPGEMGEQIVVSGIDVDRLAAGERVLLGDSAVIEVVLPRTGCARFEKIQGKTKQSVAGKMGVMARVVRGGSIRVGDPVRLMEKEQR